MFLPLRKASRGPGYPWRRALARSLLPPQGGGASDNDTKERQGRRAWAALAGRGSEPMRSIGMAPPEIHHRPHGLARPASRASGKRPPTACDQGLRPEMDVERGQIYTRGGVVALPIGHTARSNVLSRITGRTRNQFRPRLAAAALEPRPDPVRGRAGRPRRTAAGRLAIVAEPVGAEF